MNSTDLAVAASIARAASSVRTRGTCRSDRFLSRSSLKHQFPFAARTPHLPPMPGAMLPDLMRLAPIARGASVYSLVSIVRCDGRFCAVTGRRTVTVVPRPGPSLSTSTSPLWASRMCRTIDRPRPRPLSASINAVGLPMCFKGFRQMLRGDTDPGVADRNSKMRTVCSALTRTNPPRRGEFDGMTSRLANARCNCVGIAPDPPGAARGYDPFELDTLLTSHLVARHRRWR